ncbi:MAG: hypothetical protein KDI50_01195, partial [Candidatus Competibacteraceae bacterium]|nr:hypothetical protein [Candidatus Competibacteraceae bacterium]
MSALVEVKVPDIGDFKDVPVIEVFVKPGDAIQVEDPIITLESDKASMEVPSTVAGKVAEVKIQIGDKVSEGSLIITVEAAEAAASAPSPAPAKQEESAPAPKPAAPAPVAGAFSG